LGISDVNPRPAFALAAASLVLCGCTDLTGWGVPTRWATEGLELTSSAAQSQLRMPCATASSMPPLQPDATGHFELSGPASGSYASFVVILQGQLVRDTIQADLTLLAGGARGNTTHYVLVRGGDPAFERFACLATE